MTACRPPERPASSESTAQEAVYEEQLILTNATLENADEQGEIVWKVNVERVVYNDESKNAVLTAVTGNFLQDGEVVVQIQADAGEISDSGKHIQLRDNIVATDPRNGMVLRGNVLDWFPEQGLIEIEDSFQGNDDDLNVTATKAQYWSRDQRIEAVEEVVLTGTKTPVQVRTEKLVWELPEKRIKSDRNVMIDRYDPPPETAEADDGEKPAPVVSDRITAGQAEFNLEQNTVILKQNVESRSVDPPLQIASNSILWNLTTRIIIADQPVTIIDREDQTTLTANSGLANLKDEVIRVNGGARGINTRQASDLYANQIIWNIGPQRVEATGDVIYKQANPPLHLSGSRAVGTLNNQRVVVTGGGSNNSRVMTTIVP
jgi:LPS export ABC transporter protein LptC